MRSFLNQFYVFTKLSTVIVLFLILIILGYFFTKAYINQKNSENISENTLNLFNTKIIELTDLVKINSENIDYIKVKTEENEDSFVDIFSSINNLKDNNEIEQLILNLEKINTENIKLKKELELLISKIDNTKIENEPTEHNKIISNLVNLILLKLENGNSFLKEVSLLKNLDLSNLEKISYIDKLFILANQDFLSTEELYSEFDQATSVYLNYYFEKKNKNNILKYFLKFVSIQPNINSHSDDKNLNFLKLSRKNLLEKNLKNSIYQISQINDYGMYFDKWIKEVNFHIKVNKILKKI